MKITRHREFVVNMGNYESLRTGASVELDANEVAYLSGVEDQLTAMVKLADQHLDKMLAPDLHEAAALTDVHNSYVLTWLDRRDNE